MSDEFHIRCIPQIWGSCLACTDLELHIKINNELFTSLPYPNEDVADSRQSSLWPFQSDNRISIDRELGGLTYSYYFYSINE